MLAEPGKHTDFSVISGEVAAYNGFAYLSVFRVAPDAALTAVALVIA